MVVAIEGPSYSGKTTLFNKWKHRFDMSFPCYVEMAGGGSLVPGAPAKDASSQFADLLFFLNIEKRRVTSLSEKSFKSILLDRSIYSLAAHIYAMDKFFNFGLLKKSIDLIKTTSTLIPVKLFYLNTPEDILISRCENWNSSIFTNPLFNQYFKEFILNEENHFGSEIIEIDDVSKIVNMYI